jgi:plastocyanin
VGGEKSLSFKPDRLNANIGDRVTFNFYSLNHTLTQSSLEAPCVSLHQFDTGFGQFNPKDTDGLSLSLTVNTLEPQWYYCRQNDPTSHCHAGMVFALNPGDQMDQFKENAKRAVGVFSTLSGDTSRTESPIIRSSTRSSRSSVKKTQATPSPSLAAMSSAGIPDDSRATVVVVTRTVTKYCSSYSPSTLVSPTSSHSSLKRNATKTSMAPGIIFSQIILRLGTFAMCHFVFQFM